MKPRLVILGGDLDLTRMVYHRLAAEFDVAQVIIEAPVSKWDVLRRRARRLGVVTTLGQAAFVALVPPLLRRRARRRRAEILASRHLSDAAIPPSKVTRVPSVNDPQVLDIVAATQPTHVIVNGTRLITKTILAGVTVPLINIHLGWNPRYRGGNGGYWALAARDHAHCGVTVHRIDAGVDTGDVIARGPITPTTADNFTTYPLLQLAVGLDLLAAALRQPTLPHESIAGEPSAIWYHPTIIQYVHYRLVRGVR